MYRSSLSVREAVGSRTGRSFGLIVGLLLSVPLGLAACGPQAVAPEPRAGGARTTLPTKRAEETREEQSISALVGTVDAGTFGPKLSLRPDTRLVVWAAPRGQHIGLHSLALPYEGVPGAAVRLTSAIEGLRILEFRDFAERGALVLMVRRSGSQEVLEVLELAADGSLVSGPSVVAETPSEILWVDAHPTARGAVLYWAEVSRGTADLHSMALTAGSSPSRPSRVARAVSAWQLGGKESPLLATLEGSSSARQIVLRKFDSEARPVGEQLLIAQGVRGALDLDMAVAEDRTIVAFSQKSSFENRLQSVVVDSNLRVVEPLHPIMPPRGDQALVRVVASADSPEVFAVWEEPARRPLAGRSLLVSRLDARGMSKGPEATLLSPGNEPQLPAFVVNKGGLLTLAEAVNCQLGQACESPELRALVVRSSSDFQRIETNALELAQLQHGPARLVWDPQCTARGCFALAAGPGPDPAVFVLDLKARGPELLSPLIAETEAPAPRVVAQEVIGEVPELSSLHGLRVADGALLGWVSYYDSNLPEPKMTKPAPDGRMVPVRALLKTQHVGSDARGDVRLLQEAVISYRARSLGGVSVASAPERPTLLGWSALDGKEPQLFLTLVDENGKKLKQKTMKRPGGEVTDIAAVATKNGYLVAWVDAREDNPEVYAAIVDQQLELVGKEQKLTENAEQATGVALARLGDQVLLTFSDARGASRPGFADLQLIELDAVTAVAVGPSRRLAATELHSHSAALSPLGQGGTALLGWLEADPTSDAAPSALYLAELDSGGRFISPPTEVPLPGRAFGFSAECDSEECHIIAALDVSDRGELWGLAWKGRGQPGLSPLVVLQGPPSQTVAPLLLGNQVFYVDQSSAQKELLHRLTLSF